jgi:Lon-like ATP-dependent protease
VLPIGGATYKIEAAAQAGIKKVIIPKSNEADVLIEDIYKDKVQIIPVTNISEVIEHSLMGKGKDKLIQKLRDSNNSRMNFDISSIKDQIPTTTKQAKGINNV